MRFRFTRVPPLKNLQQLAKKDVDGDGFGDVTPPAGVTSGTDCDDNQAAVNEDATEVVADGIDNDCNGLEHCYADIDFDSYGDTSALIASVNMSCSDNGESTTNDDCDDSDPDTFPGAGGLIAPQFV